MNDLTLTTEGCRARRERLVRAVQEQGIELAVLTRGESVQWLTGCHVGPLFEPTAAIDAEGRVTLVLPERMLDAAAVADERVGYEAQWHSTLRNDQRQASVEALVAAIGTPPARLAGEYSRFAHYLAEKWPGQWTDIEPTMFRLRRSKHADELAMLRRANDANRRMYERAREIIEPGINELDVYSELQAVAVRELGEPLTYFGQDFQSGARGGPPRDRQAQAGELYLLDLGVGYRGYYSDNCRAVAVGGAPTDVQQQAWQRVVDIFSLVEETVAPGVSCKQLFEQVQSRLDEALPWAFNHHLGHGVGLAPHEGPHLNPHWDDTFEEGDHFTVEPGLYHDDLRAGIRLEQNYVVTAAGVELLTDWPLEL